MYMLSEGRVSYLPFISVGKDAPSLLYLCDHPSLPLNGSKMELQLTVKAYDP